MEKSKIFFEGTENGLYAWTYIFDPEDGYKNKLDVELDITDKLAKFFWDSMDDDQKDEFSKWWHSLSNSDFLHLVWENSEKSWREKVLAAYSFEHDFEDMEEAKNMLIEKANDWCGLTAEYFEW